MKRQLAVLLSAVITLSAVVGGVSTYAASESAAQAVTNQQSSEGETQSSQTSADSVQEAQTVQSTTEEKQSDPVSGQASSENSAVESTEKASENTTAAGAKQNALSAEKTGWNADHTQYIKGDGTPATGITDIDGVKYVFSTSGILQKYALVTLDGKTYAADDEGKMVTGWAKIDGSIYFFAPDGHAFKTWSRYMTGNTDRSLHNFGTDGKLLTGLQTVDGKLYYFGPEKDTSGTEVDAKIISTAAKTVSTTRINTGAGKQYTGWIRIDDSIYYFSTSDGHGYKTWSYNMTGNTDKAAYNFGTDGKLLTGLQTINGKTYYFGAQGDNSRKNVDIMITNTSNGTISKGTMNLGVGRMYKGWLKLNGKTYFMSQTDGHMFKSWSYNVTGNTKGYKYNFGSDGVMLTGWQTIGGNKYYFGTGSNSSAPTAAMTVVNSNGTVSVTNFNLWSGHAFKEWSNINGTRYYFDPNGCYLLVSTSRKIDGYVYTFNADGSVKSKVAANPGSSNLIKILTSAGSGATLSSFGGYTMSSSVKSALQSGINTARSGGHHVGFIMIDLSTGKGIQYNSGYTFYSASTIKAPYVVSLAAQNPSAIKKNMSSVRSILMYSDNNKYTSLRARYGSGCLHNWMKQAGVKNIEETKSYAYYTPKDLGRLWILIEQYYRNGSLGNTLGTYSQSANYSPIRDRLSKYKTRTKAGWIASSGRYKATNDAGIVYSTKGNYMICVMSDWPTNKSKLYKLIDAIEKAHNDMH